VYITAGHKGQPDIVASEGREGRRHKLRGKRGRGTLEDEKPPVLGMIQRQGEVAIFMLPNVQQVTIQPILSKVIKKGSLVYSDEYDIYDRLPEWGYQHKSVNHSAGEYARDEDGDGFAKFMSTPWKAFGHYSVPGYVRIEAFRRRNYLCIWVSSNLFTIYEPEVRLCFIRF